MSTSTPTPTPTPYSAFAVANAFIQRALDGRLRDLTPLKLQKLMFFAQAWHLKECDGAPLLDDHFARWHNGPVIPAIYHQFRAYGSHCIDQLAPALLREPLYEGWGVPEIPDHDENIWELIDAVIHRYGRYTGAELSEMTHTPGSAWALRGGDRSVIVNDEIRNDPTVH